MANLTYGRSYRTIDKTVDHENCEDVRRRVPEYDENSKIQNTTRIVNIVISISGVSSIDNTAAGPLISTATAAAAAAPA